jgi:hypothetical protein
MGQRFNCNREPANMRDTSLHDLTASRARSEISMTFPHASEALARFTVLDLTRVRSGPTAVRQLADWGANVIKIDALTDAEGEQPGGPRHGSDFQNAPQQARDDTQPQGRRRSGGVPKAGHTG